MNQQGRSIAKYTNEKDQTCKNEQDEANENRAYEKKTNKKNEQERTIEEK